MYIYIITYLSGWPLTWNTGKSQGTGKFMKKSGKMKFFRRCLRKC